MMSSRDINGREQYLSNAKASGVSWGGLTTSAATNPSARTDEWKRDMGELQSAPLKSPWHALPDKLKKDLEDVQGDIQRLKDQQTKNDTKRRRNQRNRARQRLKKEARQAKKDALLRAKIDRLSDKDRYER